MRLSGSGQGCSTSAPMGGTSDGIVRETQVRSFIGWEAVDLDMTMVASEMAAWPRHEGCETGDEVLAAEVDTGGSVVEEMFEAVDNLAPRIDTQAFETLRRG